MELKRVVITGLGAVTPIGNNVKDFWKNLVDGVSGAGLITRFDASKFKTRFGCEVKDFDSTHLLDRKEARKLDMFSQFALVCADEAIKDSGLDMSSIDHDRAGVIWGSGVGGMDVFLSEVRSYVLGDGTPRYNPFFIPKMIADIAGGHISIYYNLRGPNFTTVSACASSTNAIIDAAQYIQLGKAEIMVTGGSESPINEAGVGGFNAMHALSVRNDDFMRASRPFDLTRDGFVIGEGSGAFILEEYEYAKKRGAHIYAELAGGGLSADAYHLTAPHPEGLGAIRVMQNALQDANMKPEDIDYINAHGTSTQLNDVAEAMAIKKVFGEHAYKLNVSSTKSMTGHLLGAAGIIEGIAIVLAVCHDTIPPTINFETEDPNIDYKINFTFNKAQFRPVRAALSNTFGFGGHNATLIVKKLTQ
jgi:3-oxoacyl-[acyl-carrier-protein] synthase II